MTNEMAVRSAVIMTALILATALDASAQLDTPPQRIAHGLFGPSASEGDRLLSVNFSALGGYDTNLAAEQGTGSDPRFGTGGPVWGGNVGVDYSAHRERLDLGLSGLASLRYYSTAGKFVMIGDQFAGDVGFHSDRYSIRLSQAEMYSPFFMFAPVAQFSADSADLRQTPLDAAAIRRELLLYSSAGTATYSFSPRISVTGTYHVQISDYFGQSPRQTSWSGGALLRHNVSRSTALRLGYTREEGTAWSGFLPTRAHNFDAGIEYHKALGPTRRTTMSVTSGTSYIEQGPTRVYRVLVDGSLNREIGRTWVAQANYHRGLGLLGGFTTPFFADTVQGSVVGQISQRVEVRGLVSYSTGDVPTTGLRDGLRTAMASSRFRIALTQLVAFYGEYLAYRYQFDNVTPLSEFFRSHVVRQSVRTGVTVWLPILR